MKKSLFFALMIAMGVLISCGNSDCPSGVNTTNPSCPGYVAAYPAPTTQYPPTTTPYPYGQPTGQYPTNGYPYNYNQPYQYGQYPAGTQCAPGTPGCVNGYYQQQPYYPH